MLLKNVSLCTQCRAGQYCFRHVIIMLDLVIYQPKASFSKQSIFSAFGFTFEWHFMPFVGKFQQDQVNDANSAFIFLANLLISQGCQAGVSGNDIWEFGNGNG